MQTDVLIVGGAPAGLATAIAAGSRGLRVTLLDHRTLPIDKACGEGLLPEAVAVLSKLGIALDSALAHPFVGLRFSDGPRAASANFAQGQAFGIRRTVLHRLLVERAREVGVAMLWRTGISSFESGVVRAGNERISCRWLVGADGQHSRVRQLARLDSRVRRKYRFGFRRHYAAAPWTTCVDVYWATGCQLVVTPTAAGEICLSMLTNDSRLRMDVALASFFPEVAGRLEGARIVSNEAGAVTSLVRARSVARENVALVGDASCTVDGIAGQGLSLAFQQALALADSLATGDLGSYRAAHTRIVRTPMLMARLLLLMNASRALRKRAMELFARKPELFARLVAAHTRSHSQDASISAEILDLGWNLLWGR